VTAVSGRVYRGPVGNSCRPFNISSDIDLKVPIPETASGRLLLGHLSVGKMRILIPKEDFILDNGKRNETTEFLGGVERTAKKGFLWMK
jgi:DNA-binding IclR family transcriptional regulator